MTQIYQVAVVGQYLSRAIAKAFTLSLESRNGRLREGRRMPLSLVFREQGKGRRPDLVSTHGSVLDTSRRADMCSDVFHCMCVYVAQDTEILLTLQDMKAIQTLLCTALVMVSLLASTDRVRAQFTMNSIARDVNPSVGIPMEHSDIDAYILNASQVRVLKREAWNARNNVDFQVRLTGMVTQFNKSWTTNNQNSIASELVAYYYHTFTRDKYTSIFKFDGAYGMNFIDDVWFKNQDILKLYFLSSWKMRDRGLLRNWAYSFETSFMSQFAEGFKSRAVGERDQLWSNFLAPGTLTAGIGFTYHSPHPKLPFVVTINPISSNALFVMDRRIAPDRRQALGIPVSYAPDDENHEHPIFKKTKVEGGSNLNVGFNRTFALGKGKKTTLQYNTTLNSFYGWITQVTRHEPPVGMTAPLAIMPTVRWDNSFVFSPLKFLAMEFRTSTIYDRSQVDRVQMQYYLRVGLTYRYKNR